MSDFDWWLIERLTLCGCLIFGDAAPDVSGALSLFQRAIGLPVTAFADDLTIHYLRQSHGHDPEGVHMFFDAVPPRDGSRFMMTEMAA